MTPLADLADPAALLAEAGLPPDTPWSPLRYLGLRIEHERVHRVTQRIVGLPWPWTPLAAMSGKRLRTLTQHLGQDLCVAWTRAHFHDRRPQLPAIFEAALPDLLDRMHKEDVDASLEPLLDATDEMLLRLCRQRRGNKLLRSVGLTLLATLHRDLDPTDAEAVTQSSPSFANLPNIRPLTDVPTDPIRGLLHKRLTR